MTGNTERNANQVPSLTAKSNAGDNADVILWADPSTHRLLTNSSISGGSLSNNNAAPSNNNIGVLPAVANAAAPSYTEGNQVLLSTDLSGALRVTGSLSVGGTTDGATFTAGSSTGTPAMGAYHSVIDTVTDGKQAIIGITSKRAIMASLFDASGNALLGQKTTANSIPVALASDASLAVTNAGTFAVQATLAAETTKVIGTVRNLGNAGAVFDGVITAATAPANGVMILGVYNSTEPSPTTGQSVGIQLDSKGRQRMVIMDAAGNTRGLNVDASGQIAVTFASGQTVGLVAGSAIVGKFTTDQTTHGTTDLVAADITKVAGGAITATNVAITDAPFNLGAQAVSAENSAVTAGRKVQLVADLTGKQIVMPYANKENFVSGVASTTGTSDTAVIAAQGAGLFIYITSITVVNTGATASLVTIETDTASAKTAIWYVIAPAGGGTVVNFPVPIKGSVANKNVGFVCGSASTTIYCSLAGYSGT